MAPGAFTLSAASTPVNLAGGVVGGQATGSNTIPANNLGWDPDAHNVNSESGQVVKGALVAPVTAGLGTARTLCNTAAGQNAGAFECGAALTLKIPQNARPGAYAATLTLTLV